MRMGAKSLLLLPFLSSPPCSSAFLFRLSVFITKVGKVGKVGRYVSMYVSMYAYAWIAFFFDLLPGDEQAITKQNNKKVPPARF
jgi:hypothetical protein